MDRFWQAYLFAYLFVTGLAIGTLGLLLIHTLTGGVWGEAIRRPMERVAGKIPWFALGLVPLLYGLKHLYPWVDASVLALDPGLRQKAAYLNVPFFWMRTVVFFAVWSVLGWMAARVRTPEARRNLGGIGLVLYALTATFFAVDWFMSLEPHWSSTIYGAMVVIGQILAALAFFIVGNVRRPAVSEAASHDLGNLLLAFVMFWAYLAFSQYLIIWSGNLPAEIPWYLRRQAGIWAAVAVSLILLHFALPFFLLLHRPIKRQVRRLAWVAGLVLVMRVIDTVWLIYPAFGKYP